MKKPNYTNEIQSHLSNGNRKIGKDTAIFNITSAADCVADKLGLCNNSKICYAKKAERLYPQVLPYRRRQTEVWDRYSFREFADAIGTYKGGKIKYFRFNESGDLRNSKDVLKLANLAALLKDMYGIVTYGYTARIDLDLELLAKYAIVQTSNFQIDGLNSFYAVKQFSDGALKCKGDCNCCQLCKVNHGKKIEVLHH